ncbi:flagellar biosynthesis anti-sigma factor FlgM [Chromatiaceae bacterium AAb-1]|nr:flagellar biosynthesis anti-sigma factor FlgM [Chromatiaceae bacterium AAb-1]
MAININNLQSNSQVKTDKPEQGRQQSALQQTTAQQTSSHKQDSVSLTPQAQQFSKVQEKISNSSGIDQEKIEKIRQAIADGKYKINVEQLAKRIVQFENDFFEEK